MKRVRLIHLCSITLVTSLLASGQLAHGQITGLMSGPQPPRGKPFVGVNAPLPKEVTRKPLRHGRADGITAGTVDITPNTPTVTDGAPFWTTDERYVYFHSNRANLAGTTAGTLFHIYRMNPSGAGVTAVTGPLATPVIGATASQTEPAVSPTGAQLVYIETSASGAVDLVELNLNTGATKSLVKNNPTYRFVALNGPEYGAWPGMNAAVLFAGKTSASAPFKLYAVDTQTGVIAQVTTGISDDRNPTVSPPEGTTYTNSIIAFDSNRADPSGNSTKATRDIWVIPIESTAVPATRVTNFSVGGQYADNIEPSWSTNKVDSSGYVNGQQMIAFASTRYDTDNDGNANAINPNGSCDIYWLKVTIGRDQQNHQTVLTPESQANVAYKLPTGDPRHVYDDRLPVWPQFIASYRVIFQSNRTSYNPVTETSEPANPTPTTPTDLFASTLMDLNAPTLVRYNESSGEIVNVEPRLAAPGMPVRIAVKVADLETGIRDVYVQIKNPNSKYQSSDGREHKVYFGVGLNLDGNNTALQVPVEFESERIYIGDDPTNPLVGTYARPRYIASVDDAWAFSGGASPPDRAWLKLQFESRDPATGVSTYSATWTTDRYPSDYYIDVIAYDNAKDPFSGDSINWKIYDNVWGFSTEPFQAGAHGILFVSDYAAGQKFFSSRFGQADLVNVHHTFWGTESWMTDIDVNLLPRTYQTSSTTGSLVNVLNALGVKSYGAYDPRDPYTGLGADGSVLDGSMADGVDVPVTQQYDIWRILCRGPVPDSVLAQYLPHTVQQPPDIVAGEKTPRTVTVANKCVIWHAPFTGNVFAGPGTLTDLQTQTQLHAFLQAGGRLLVNGQDIAWALTLDGAVANSFVTTDLKAQYVRDAAQATWFRIGGVGLMYGISSAYQLTGAGAYNPISHDPWVNTPNKYVPSSHHQWPGPPFPPGNEDYISRDPNYFAAGSDQNNPRTLACPAAFYPDVVNSIGGAVPDLTYGGGGTAVHHYLDSTTGARVVYVPMGLEGLFPDWFNPPNTQNIIALKNRRTELLHNFVCWARTGVVSGTVLDVEGAGAPLANVLVRLSNKQISGSRVTAYTALTAEDGRFFIDGVEPDDYDISAVKPGYTIQKPTIVTVHGGARDEISFRMTKAEPAVVQGKVTRMDGTTPVVGATVTLRDVMPPNATFTATTDAQGNYTISRVPSQTTYTLTCSAPGYGDSVPASYPVPNPNDPIQGQRDTLVVPAKVYVGFDFKLKAEQGAATGRVIADATDQPIAGATVTATMGSQTVTAVTDANGVYSFNKNNTPPNGLDPGTWGLVAAAPGYQPNTPVSVVVNSNETANVPDIRLQTVPPGSISGLVTRTSDGAPQAGVRVEVRDPAGNLVAVGTTGAATTVNGYTYNYKLDNVPAGVTYTVTVSATGFTPIPASRQAAVTSGTETKNVNFQMDPLHTFSSQLSLVSVPFDYTGTDAGDLLSIPAQDRTNGSFLLATWDLRKYQYYPQDTVKYLQLGRGYFMAYKTNIPLSTEGVTADTSRPFDIPLTVGWNLIGNPFRFDLDWTKVMVLDGGALKSFSDAVATGAISSALYTYISGSYVLDYKLVPWRGYWVRAYRNVILRLDPVAGGYGRSASLPAGRAVLRGSTGWSVNLSVRLNGAADSDNRFGQAVGAADSFDAFKVEKPPVFGDHYVYLTFDHPEWGDRAGGYGVDVRAATPTPRTWEFTVRTAAGQGTAVLSWPDVASAPRDVNLTLVDVSTGVTRDMRSNSSYTWLAPAEPSERKFRVEVTRRDGSALRITNVNATQIGRSNLSEVTFVTSATANISARVLSTNGTVVRNLPVQSGRAAGQQQVRWDQRDARGIVMPAGSYMVELRAVTPDGKQSARAVAVLMVTR